VRMSGREEKVDLVEQYLAKSASGLSIVPTQTYQYPSSNNQFKRSKNIVKKLYNHNYAEDAKLEKY